MERYKRGVIFWVLLITSIALPVSAQKAIKKQLYGTNIAVNGTGVGTATIVLSQSSPTYMVRTYGQPNHVVTRVALQRNDGSWPGEIVLCENGTSAGDCTYDDSNGGNLDIEGAIVAPMFPAGVTGGDFLNALQGGTLSIQLNYGAAGTGVFVRYM
jgi:hypothetical protein